MLVVIYVEDALLNACGNLEDALLNACGNLEDALLNACGNFQELFCGLHWSSMFFMKVTVIYEYISIIQWRELKKG